MVGPKGGAITPWPSPKYATDVCHMLKLLRNTFASQTMVDGDGHQIKWTYIEELHKLQEAEGLRAANKLKTAHIEWSRQ